MPKGQRDLSWDVVETKKPDASAKRPPPPVDDAVRAHAEWFAWAKRHKADFGRAHGAARKAVAASEQTDALDAQGDAYADLAEVLSLAGRPKEATEALEQALARYERKGNVVMAQRAQTRLAELQDAAPR